MTMSVIRISKREHPYAQIDKRILEDARLSWRAKGVLCYLLSKPDNWRVSVSDVWKSGKEGRNAVQETMAELSEFGYATLEVERDEKGVLMGKIWTISEEPILGFSDTTDKPKIIKPKNRLSGFRRHSNNINSSNNEEREGGSEKKSPTPPAAENLTRSEPEKKCPPIPPPPPTHSDTLPGAMPAVAAAEPNQGYPSSPINTPHRIGLKPLAVNGDEAEAVITEWVKENIETVKFKYERSKRAFTNSDLEKLVVKFCGQYSSHPDTGVMQRFLTDPATFFNNKLSSWLVDQPKFERMAEPKGGASRDDARYVAPRASEKIPAYTP